MATTRRDFLKGTSALVVSFTLIPSVARGQAARRTKTNATDQVDAFLAIGADGRVTVYTGKVDLGTGTRTALRQLAAEELDVRLSRVDLVEGDTALTPDQGPTWGSLTISHGGQTIRQAAATARRELIVQAAQRLGIATDNLEVRDGVVFSRWDKTVSVSYEELIGSEPLNLKVDPKVALKKPADYRIIGKSIPRVDVPAKVTGEFTYMQDFRVPNMLHARVVRPPAIGATLQSVDESSVAGIKGLHKVVRVGNFLAVTATSEWSAVKAARQLKATWSAWEGLPEQDTLYDVVRTAKVDQAQVTLNVGDPKVAMGRAAKTVSATYEFPVHTHGSIGPSAAIAQWTDGGVTVWSASQATHWLRRDLAASFAVPVDKIRVIYLDGAGCYGRNGHEDAAADAVLLARELKRPVRVQWSREDEHGWDPKGPPTLIELSGGVDAQGNIVAWESEFWIPKATITEAPPLVAATLAGLPTKDILNPGNVFQNSAPGYTLPNARAVCYRLETTPFRPSWIRTPGRMQNTYANEAFLDELAAAAGVDPIEFRMRHLKDKRGAEVLKAAAEAARWDKRPSPKKDARGSSGIARGRGVSYVKYENVRTYVAAVAEVEVDRKSGHVRCTKVTVSHDCGQIVNPEGVKTQIEGNIIQTVSRTLVEELKWNKSRVTSVDWASYPILRFPDVPDVDIVLLDKPNEPAWGAGEPAAAVVPSAISNAIFDAIGVRLRTVPFTPDRVKAALKA
ncbi:MAG TPA: molybdopterin cofactor-binding domain-containing protein [Terriglobales bacterium]|nr:molybdopterin cofactor-binding domain-containing protein [Terriglobales bacterium]